MKTTAMTPEEMRIERLMPQKMPNKEARQQVSASLSANQSVKKNADKVHPTPTRSTKSQAWGQACF